VSLRDGQPVLSGRVAPAGDRYFATPRYSDSKLGRKLIGVALSVVSKTYGVVSEAGDLAEAFAWSLYGKTTLGAVVPAMVLTNGSALEAFHGYLEGDFRLDTVGFVQDYSMQQLGDVFVGRVSKYVDRTVFAAGYGGPLGITSSTTGIGASDVLSQGYGEFSSYVRSQDVRRSSRTSQLWS